MKPKNVKHAMYDDRLMIKSIYAKGSKTIRVDFVARFGTGHWSFWINRDYFKRQYPLAYDRF